MPIDSNKATEQWMRFQYCRDRGHLEFVEKSEKCDKFFQGLQWDKADLAVLQAQRRPALTINKIISTVSSILGEQIFNRAEVGFRPRSGAPEATADALQKVWMQIASNNQLPWVRSDMFADGIIRSRGFYDVRLNFDDNMRGEVAITQLNGKNVVVDPDAEEYDPDKWNDVFTSKWLTAQDIGILYSKDDMELLKDREASAFPYGYDSIDRTRDRFGGSRDLAGYYGVHEPHHVRRNIRVLERQYRELTSQKHFVDPQTGDMRPIPDDWKREKIGHVMGLYNLNVINKLTKRIKWTVTADNVVLHDEWSPYKHFTVVPYFPFFRYGTTIGIVENLLGPQELLNKTSSQELHVINTTANSGWKLKRGALQNMSVEELEESGAKTGLVMELDDVSNAEKILPNPIPQGLERLTYKAEEYIKSVSLVTDNMQGNDREDVAAKAIGYKQQRSSINFSKVMDNLQRTDWILARNVLDIVQEFYSEEMLINITHEATNETESVAVNQRTPEGDIMNDLTIGEYDIVITSVPYRATLEDSQFEQGMSMRENGIAIPDEFIIQNSRMTNKAEIIKAVKGDGNSPEAQAAAALQQRSAQAEVAKTEAEATQKQADAQLKTAKAQKEAGEAAVGPQDPTALEAERMDREFALKREQADRDHTLKQQEMERKFALEKEAAAAKAQTDRIEATRKQFETPTKGGTP